MPLIKNALHACPLAFREFSIEALFDGLGSLMREPFFPPQVHHPLVSKPAARCFFAPHFLAALALLASGQGLSDEFGVPARLFYP
jgi:hypothetical protein